MNTLHLTKDEKTAYDALPASLREGWEVAEETGTAYETDEALKIRAHMSSLSEIPQLKQLMDDAHAGRAPEPSVLREIPERYHKDLFFTIGAKGLAFIIERALPAVRDDEGLHAIAWMSAARHELLENNASIAYA